MKTITTITAAIILSSVLAFSGCKHNQDILVHQQDTTLPFGSSVRMAIQSQTLNPNPPSMEPVSGQDGTYTQKVLEAYQKGPEEEGSGMSIIDKIFGN